MKQVALSFIVFLAVSLSACAIAPTDLSGINVGATRATVEDVLGKPVESMQSDTGRIDVYKYNKGYTPTASSMPRHDLDMAILTFPFWIPLLPIVHERQREDIDIIYGPDDTVVHHGTGLTKQQAEKALQEFLKAKQEFLKAEQKAKQEFLKAEQGDADAQYHVSRRYGAKGWKWLCLAANQGHNRAQYSMGDYYQWGQNWPIVAYDFEAVEADYVHAYMWYSLAASNRYDPAESKGDLLAEIMTPEQAAEGKRLAAEWKPGDCGAEGSPTKSAG